MITVEKTIENMQDLTSYLGPGKVAEAIGTKTANLKLRITGGVDWNFSDLLAIKGAFNVPIEDLVSMIGAENISFRGWDLQDVVNAKAGGVFDLSDEVIKESMETHPKIVRERKPKSDKGPGRPKKEKAQKAE